MFWIGLTVVLESFILFFLRLVHFARKKPYKMGTPVVSQNQKSDTTKKT